MDDQESDEEEWDEAKTREAAERLLAQRGHARAELERKLDQRGVPLEPMRSVCDTLEEEGTLDDERFARHQAEVLRDKQWGPIQIRHKLGKRGVDDEVIDRVLDEVGGREVWLRHCWERADQKYSGDPGELGEKEKQKAFRHLKHRGYQPSLIRRIIFDGASPQH
jgi:regulatory protein